MGNYDRNHILVQWGGTLPGKEEWSCGVRMANDMVGNNMSSLPSAGELQTWLDGSLKDAVQAFHTRATSHISGWCLLTFVKANIVGMDGRYVDNITHEHVFTPTPGDSVSPLYPNQVALVASLTTGLARGPAHRGRFYMPLPAIALEPSTGAIAVGGAIDVAGSVKTFIEALSDTPGIDIASDVNVCVMSRKTGAAATHKVTGVEVGRVLDTQRRRRRSLDEQYAATDVDLGVF